MTHCQRCGKATENIHTCTPNPVITTLHKQLDIAIQALGELAHYDWKGRPINDAAIAYERLTRNDTRNGT